VANHLRLKTRLFNIARLPFLFPPLERYLVRHTVGKPFQGLCSKLPANHYQYPPDSVRVIERYGIRFEVDISDLIGWYLYFGFLDPSHEALLSLCSPGDVVLDVGANIGLTPLRIASAVGSGGHVYAFEPYDKSYQQCLRNIEINRMENIEVIKAALADHAGKASLEVPDIHNLGRNRIRFSIARPEFDCVPLTTVDAFVDDRALPRVDVIKIDVEGFESFVLQGAKMTLEKYRPRLFIEFHGDLLADYGKSAEGLLQYLEGFGFVCSSARNGSIMTAATVDRNVKDDLVCLPS
jgi:FkbM family methyltransferase